LKWNMGWMNDSLEYFSKGATSRSGRSRRGQVVVVEAAVHPEHAGTQALVHAPPPGRPGTGRPRRGTSRAARRVARRCRGPERARGGPAGLAIGEKGPGLWVPRPCAGYDSCQPRSLLRGRAPPPSGATIRPLRRDRIGGLRHEYLQVA
jgi:hypothetical protein